MNQKSETCFGKQSKEPLTEYDTEIEAEEAAEYANENYQRNLTPYQCSKCFLWHLGLKDRQTPSKKCRFCTGRDGNYKDSYLSKEDAQRRADIIDF